MSIQKLRQFFEKKTLLFELLTIFIITIPAFFVLLQPGYFTMHDDQHIVRLFLFDQGLKQGQLYPRWVDGLGFGFGYPLFNFYPPLIYFIGEGFHILGFSLIWSIKLMVITGFFLAAWGMYLLTKKIFGKMAAFTSATLYTYFFYHAVNAYVRGALAEFFTMSVLPFIFLTIYNLSIKPNLRNSIWFGITLSLLILAHPLIAFPSVFYITIFLLFPLTFKKAFQEKISYIKYIVIGGLLGLSLSMFFWLPSLVEKQYTLVNAILTKELANYKLHFIYPIQFLYSLWGYGGSGEGLSDGMTFQLGKIHIALAVMSIIVWIVLFVRHTEEKKNLRYFIVFFFFLLFSLFMTTSFSSFIWSSISYLWYLQFPWRFLTFTAIFISITGGATIFMLEKLSLPSFIRSIIVVIICISTIFIYSKYFKPMAIRHVTDKDLTTFEEVSWRISGTSFEFVPQGVKTVKSPMGTTQLAIHREQITPDSYTLLSGKADINQTKNFFHSQTFQISATTPIIFRLNTYNFPGWKASIQEENNKKILDIDDTNDLKLITVKLPKGIYTLHFDFENTPIRAVSDAVSIIAGISILLFFIRGSTFLNQKEL